jgi:hypothetical protein
VLPDRESSPKNNLRSGTPCSHYDAIPSGSGVVLEQCVGAYPDLGMSCRAVRR